MSNDQLRKSGTEGNVGKGGESSATLTEQENEKSERPEVQRQDSTRTDVETAPASADVGGDRDQRHAEDETNINNITSEDTSSTEEAKKDDASSSQGLDTTSTSPSPVDEDEMPPVATITENPPTPDGGSVEEAKNLTAFDTAFELFQGKADFVDHDQIASWLGDSGPERADVRNYYMSLFDWTGKSVLSAVRGLCDKLYMKAESQQLDRIIDSFADRWCECNPQHGFKSPGVIYTLAYSILLLNTDHHSEDYQGNKKMGRSQYVQQTLGTMKNLLQAEDCDFSNLSGDMENNDLESISSKRKGSIDSVGHRPSISGSSSRKRWSANLTSIPKFDNTSLVCDSTLYSSKEWEGIVVSMLKTVYASIDMNPLNLARNRSSHKLNLQPQTSMSSLNKQVSGKSENRNSLLNRFSINRRSSWMSSDNWSDYNYQDAIISNETRPNSVKSHYLTKRRSMYAESTNNMFGLENIGFAGALRNTMIQEENNFGPTALSSSSSGDKTDKSPMLADGISMVSDTASFMTSAQGSIAEQESKGVEKVDQNLALHGAPWAKEGLLKFQAFLDTANVTKKYKKRDWVEVFVVVQNGYLKMFRFDTKGGAGGNLNHRRSKYNLTNGSSSVYSSHQASSTNVGAGNWLDNATMTDNISLCHTMAQVNPENKDSDLSAISSNGNKRSSVIISSCSYNASPKADATQWSLTLPSQGVLLFQAGTREIADEYVYSCNYWAARASKEPLVEAVTSIEHGWERPLEILQKKREENPDTDSIITSGSFDVLLIDSERIQVKEWKPPVQSTAHCTLSEEEQLNSLKQYISKVQQTLEKHSSVRSDMMKVFQTGHLVSTRAHANWEKRSQYLLKESVKYDTYVTTLERAVQERQKVEDETAQRKTSHSTMKANDNTSTTDNNDNDEPQPTSPQQ